LTSGPARLVKAALDRLLALVGLVALSPVLALIAAIIVLSLGRPAFFRQIRPGLRGRPFSLLKFRTMRESGGPDGDRLTPVGRFLRKWSLDELPELWNVLRGEMSLVGPRPLLVEYLPRYSPEQARRHEVRPGLTGWAQVNGRNTTTWEERFRLDVWYVDHRSLRLDLWVLWRTLVTVVRRDGIAADGHATMPEFLGSGGSR